MLAHKMRVALTLVSIGLGVAFLAGTLMLTDSMQRAFDDVFANVNSGTDVAVRSEAGPVKTEDPDDAHAPVPQALLPTVAGVEGVAVAEGSVKGYALLTDSHGKPIQPNGAPTMGGNLSVDPALRGKVTLRSGHAPARPEELAVDASSAKNGGLTLGSRVKVLFREHPRTFRLVGI